MVRTRTLEMVPSTRVSGGSFKTSTPSKSGTGNEYRVTSLEKTKRTYDAVVEKGLRVPRPLPDRARARAAWLRKVADLFWRERLLFARPGLCERLDLSSVTVAGLGRVSLRAVTRRSRWLGPCCGGSWSVWRASASNDRPRFAILVGFSRVVETMS